LIIDEKKQADHRPKFTGKKIPCKYQASSIPQGAGDNHRPIFDGGEEPTPHTAHQPG
jgi:hypothetical protein